MYRPGVPVHLCSADEGAVGAAEQRDAADEGRWDAYGGIIVGNEIIVNQGEVVRPSQLIASVRQARAGGEHEQRPGARGLATDSAA